MFGGKSEYNLCYFSQTGLELQVRTCNYNWRVVLVQCRRSVWIRSPLNGALGMYGAACCPTCW